jgi:hypothetical protein
MDLQCIANGNSLGDTPPMRSLHLMWSLAVACLMIPSVSHADAIPPPKAITCGRGQVAHTGHGGTHCEYMACRTDADCPSGMFCVARDETHCDPRGAPCSTSRVSRCSPTRGSTTPGPKKPATPLADQTEELVKAVSGNNEVAIRALVKAGADVNTLRKLQGESALHFAAWADTVKPATLKVLLAVGGDPRSKDRQGRVALVHAATNAEYKTLELDKVKILGPLTRDPAARVAALQACLHHRYSDDAKKIIRYLVDDLKVDVNGKDVRGLTPLMRASSVAFHETVALLIARGAKVNERDRKGDTALMHALAHYEVIVTESESGESMEDLSSEFRKTLELLLKKKADATIKNNAGQTAIVAYLGGEALQHTTKLAPQVIQSLIKAGASTDGAQKSLDEARENLPKPVYTAIQRALRARPR